MVSSDQVIWLLSTSENPKLEFKSGWYTNATKLDDKGWGEFLKDLIALANGNIGYTDQPAYLIVGAMDDDPLPGEDRQIQNVPAVCMLSNLQQLRDNTLTKLRVACSPSLPEIQFQLGAVTLSYQRVLRHQISP